MYRRAIILGFVCAIAAGCATVDPRVPPIVPVASHFRAAGFDWASVRRILLVPLANETDSPFAAAELADALAAQLQSSGRFEIIRAAQDDGISCAETLRVHGRFDERELLDLAADYQADAVLFGVVTQYHAYAPPRVGLSLRLISPSHAALIASVDGLWDARDQWVADHARYYNVVVLKGERSLLGGDRVLESPHLFQRFACHEVVHALAGPELP